MHRARRRTTLLAWTVCTLALVGARADAGDWIFGNGFDDTARSTLVVHYPAGAQSMTARGDGGGLSWTQGTAFARAGDTFTLVLDLAAPAQWKPLLDDTTYSLGPNYPIAPGQTIEVWPHFFVTQGQVVTLIAAFQSSTLGNSRAIYAYLPPTYVENTAARMPVVYMHDGQNLYAAHPEWAIGGVTWSVDTAFDSAAASGAFAEAIVIGVANTPDRIHEYTPTPDPNYPGSGGADAYLQMLGDELKPVVDAMRRTRADAGSTLMAGSSLGGLVTAYAGRMKPTVFTRVAALSPSSWWDNSVIVSDVQTTPPPPNRPLRVYVDSGDSPAESLATTNALAAAYVSVGYAEGVDFHHVVQPGGQHNETYWAQRFPGAMAFLLGPRD
jgi:predicted alpha/beta superfamily hydrolase